MRIFVATLILAAFLSPACGGGSSSSSSPTAPTPQTLEGTWRATKAQFVSKSSSSRQVDIVAQGSTVTMVFSGSNYTFTQTETGKPQQVQTGTWSASTDVMTLRPTGVTWSIEFDMTFSGNNLTLNGGSVQFDFTGTFEEARLYMTLVRQ
jgi:hypothetical protein